MLNGLSGFRFLSIANINTLVKTLQAEVDIARPYTFLARTPIVDAPDDEIFGTYSGNVIAADIIADDQEAVIVEGGQLETRIAGIIPKLKIGSRVSESMIRKLATLDANLQLAEPDADIITGWENRLAQKLVEGIRMRQNMLCCAMMLDAVTYDRLGIKISGGWNTPSALKVVLSGSNRWSTDGGATANTAAKPLTDIRTLALTAQTSYGQPYDRVTMGRKTFDFITQTQEFADAAKFVYRFDLPAGVLNLNSVPNLLSLFQTITGLSVEIDDATYKERLVGGQLKATRVLPLNYVILSNSADDGDPSVMDLANGECIEPLVAKIFNADAASDFGGNNFGPVSYYTGNANLNPPDLVAYAVSRNFPRKHVVSATANIQAW